MRKNISHSLKSYTAAQGNRPYISSLPIQKLPVWDIIRKNQSLSSFELEITARCNNNCRHCYINLPAGDKTAERAELTPEEISRLADEAVSLGALWCTLTGGEPLLRKDFNKIYFDLKKKGLLVSVFTNGTLINIEHVRMFKRFPPRDIEVTVYGVTEETYENITRKKGSFSAFKKGLDLLFDNNVKVRLKAMALRSNLHEFQEIIQFCREKTKDYYRFDPFLHLRFDGNPKRNQEIRSERLQPEEIVSLERSDPNRIHVLEKACTEMIGPEFSYDCGHLFHCGAGKGLFTLGYDGTFRLCSSLWAPDCLYDLKKGTLTQALGEFVDKVRQKRSYSEVYLNNCLKCQLKNICSWCPATAYLENGELDSMVEYFCEAAHARAEALNITLNNDK